MKHLLHIDTLYLYRKTFTEYDHLQCLNIVYELNPKDLGYSKGYQWYDLGYCRIGFMDYEVSLRSGNFSIILQYNATYLLQTDFENITLPFGNDNKLYLIKRIDFSVTVNTLKYVDFNLLDSIAVSKNFKKSSYILGKDRKVETAYLGLRKTGKVFRMYNKTKELSDNKNHLKKQILSSFFGDTSSLTVFEIELHRKYLKDRASISDISQINDVRRLVASLFLGLKFCDNTPLNKNLLSSKNNKDIDFYSPFNSVFNEQIFILNTVKKYSKSKSMLIKNISDLLSNYNSDDKDILTTDDIYIALSSLENNDTIKNIDIEYDKDINYE